MPSEEGKEGITEETLKLAIDALKASGYHVITQEVMADRLKKAAKDIDPLKTQVTELEEQLSMATKSLKKFEDKDKSAEQRIADELKAKQDMIEAYQLKLDAQQKQTEAERKRGMDMFKRNELLSILSPSINPGAATRLAMGDLDGLGVDIDDSGKYHLTYTGPDKLPGDAKEAVTSWYKEQTFLHPPSGEGVPVGSVNPPNGNGKKTWDQMDSEDRFERAFFGNSE
jgi:hypothetical protein